MPVTIVVGGQYGSEGKGKTVAALSLLYNSPHVVRCGGPNSGHTVSWRGKDIVLRQVPAGVVNPKAHLYVAAGCVINEDVLENELDLLGVPKEFITVDERAVLVGNEHISSEIQAELSRQISSTCSGNGAALAQRLARDPKVVLAQHSFRLRSRVRIGCVATRLHTAMEENEKVIVEGTQGFGLSLLHGLSYPYVTSKDTTASGFASEVGISPRDVSCIIMVVRTFPIRVGGNSGPLPFETTWETIQQTAGIARDITEYTSVTKRVRRVARFDFDMIRAAARYNRPNAIALLGVDLLAFTNSNARKFDDFMPNTKEFVANVERACGAPVVLFGTGQSAQDYFVVEDKLASLAAFSTDPKRRKLTA